MSKLDPFEKKPVVAGGPKHKRPGNVSSGGLFCMNCGEPVGVDVINHGPSYCVYNPELVNELRKINLW